MKITRFITASALFLIALVSAVSAQTVEVRTPRNGPLNGLPPSVTCWLSNITKTSRRQSICRVRLSLRE